jgi:hypothetical protein
MLAEHLAPIDVEVGLPQFGKRNLTFQGRQADADLVGSCAEMEPDLTWKGSCGVSRENRVDDARQASQNDA